MDPAPKTPSRRIVRSLIFPAGVMVVAAIVLLALWAPDETADAQRRTIRTMITAVATALALLVWLAFLSPFRWRTRGIALGVVGFLAGAFLAAFRIEGTSGNLVPKLRPRWAGPRDAGLGALEIAAAPVSDPGVAFPQFLGPGRDAVVPGLGIARDWGARPPRILWKRELGAAWSGFAVARGRAVTQEQRGAEELVVCYELVTGRPLWRHADPARYETTLGGVGPRATPTIDGDRVFTLGATGILNALEIETGRRVWSADIARDAGATMPAYGYSGSPLVEGGRVIVQAGGRAGASLVAYDRATGKRSWSAGSDRAAYASPRAAVLGGRRQIVMLNWDSCTGHDPETGSELWRFEWRGEQPKAAQPVELGGDRLAISAGYGVGTDAFRVAESGGAWRAEPLWRSSGLMAKFTNVVVREGHLYGLSDGVLACVKADTGERAWRAGRYGHGQLLLAGDLLVISTEQGAVALVEADPSAHREAASFQALEGKTWNSPALAGPWLLLRNDREAACLELPRIGR